SRIQMQLYAAIIIITAMKMSNIMMVRKYHRHHCPHRRCLPLHSRVPFP
uniref:Apelin receptor early endogenous ligand n=1 Tax=Myripristis murdjan TaxID=586833 RepID=A0A667Z866_9TELE